MLPEAWSAFREAAGLQLGWFALAALGAVALIAGARWIERRDRPTAATWIRHVLVAGAASFGLYLAWQRLWLCDDAFITFRYADNFARGRGLVFNPGEWVEGYTNFLWTLVLGLAGKLGLEIPLVGLFGNLLTFVAAVVLTGFVVARVVAAPAGPPRGPEQPGRALAVPFAALALGGSVGFTTFASSGLETMPATALVVAGIAAIVVNRPLLSGTFLVLAALTRPDHLLFWGCMGLALALEDAVYNAGPLLKRARWGRYLRFTLPLLVLYVPYFIWRWQAYGDVFPNTYYAKSGNLAYYKQGGIYAFVWAASNGAWVWLPALIFAALGRPLGRNEWRLRLFALLSVIIFGRYVVKVGGDFMQDRFFVVLWPVVLIALEVTLRARLAAAPTRRRAWAWVPLGAAAAAAAVVPVNLLPEGKTRWHLAAEHSFYRVKSFQPVEIGSPYFRRAKRYADAFGDLSDLPKLAIGCVGMVGYYSDLPLVDLFGLTNRRIAHNPVKKRGRPGHEKVGTLTDILAEGAVLSQYLRHDKRWTDLARISLPGEPVYLVRDSATLRKALKGRATVRFPPLPTAALERAIGAVSRSEALADWVFLSRFVDPSTHGARLAALEARLGSVAEFEHGAMPATAQISGDAVGPATGTLPPGATGNGWLRLGAGRRTVTIPVELGAHDDLRFVLGGTVSAGHRVELRAGGKVLHSASPEPGGHLRPVSWDVDGVGLAELVLVDEEADPQAYMDVDGVHVPGPGQIGDTLRRRDLHAPLRWLDAQAAVQAELPVGHPDRALLNRVVGQHDDFEYAAWPAGIEVEGTAFGSGPVTGRVADQGPITGFTGVRFINSYHGKDAATGVLRLPEFEITGQPLALRIAGSADCDSVFVGLEVEGEVVARTCGRGDEVLRPAVINTHEHVGKRGRVVMVDRGTRAWAHLLVDDLVRMRNPASSQAITPLSPMR